MPHSLLEDRSGTRDEHSQHGRQGHVHATTNFGFAFATGIGLNIAFVIVEVFFGITSNSTALVADAGHNLSDVLGLAVAWLATFLSRRAPSARFTYGLRGSSILAALFNAVFLLIAVGAIAWEAIQRLFHPEPVAGVTVMIVAAVGIAINGITAGLFASGRKSDINIQGAFLHMAADAAVSVGVVLAGLAILFTGWIWLDVATSLVISAAIAAGTWTLLRDSMAMSLDSVPTGIDPGAVRRFLEKLKGVVEIHDLHIWPLSTTEVALTCHLVMPSGHPGDACLAEIARRLHNDFDIHHATIQIETDPELICALAPAHIV